jgi:hypothetical protein
MVTINGRLSLYQNKPQIVIHSFGIESNPMCQILNWCKAIELSVHYKDQYRPEIAFELPNKVVKRPQNSLLIAIKEIFVEKGRVSFPDLVAHQELQQIVKTQIENASRLQIEQSIANEMRKLLKDGIIHLLDESNQIYGHTTMDNLGALIKKIVITESMSLREQYDGIFVDEIMVLLQSTPFKTIPQHHVQKMVNSMISNNQLQKQGNKIRAFC